MPCVQTRHELGMFCSNWFARSLSRFSRVCATFAHYRLVCILGCTLRDRSGYSVSVSDNAVPDVVFYSDDSRSRTVALAVYSTQALNSDGLALVFCAVAWFHRTLRISSTNKMGFAIWTTNGLASITRSSLLRITLDSLPRARARGIEL